MSEHLCPREAALLAFVTGEPPQSGLRSHLAICPKCRRRARLLLDEVILLRELGNDRSPPAPET
jgi:hypothetical protein